VRKPEQKVWDTMKTKFGNRPGLWLERVENVVAEGMPDVFGATRGASHRGGVFFIELKAAKLPARSTTKVLGDAGLRVSQLGWHKKAFIYGLSVYTLIRDDKRNLYFIPCALSDALNDMPLQALIEASVATTWEEIAEILES